MGYGNRVLNAKGDVAEGDKQFQEFVYNDVAGNLTQGMPVFADLTDAAENNAVLHGNPATVLNPAKAATGGNVVLATNANAGVCVGVFFPNNPSEAPKPGDVIRVAKDGTRCVVSAISETGNANALKVGDFLVAKATTTSGSTAAAAPVVGTTFAQVLATGANQAKGNQIAAAASNAATLVNAIVCLR